MEWINNTKNKKPELDTNYENDKWSVTVLFHIKMGLTFMGCWNYETNCWHADGMKFDDKEVLFWLNIPKLPKFGTIVDK